MTGKFWGLTALTAALAASPAVAQQDPNRPAPPPPAERGVGERVGETVDRAAGRIREGVRETAETVREQFGRAKTSVQAMGVQARIYSRLHWDKALYEADLSLDVSRDGVATLRGAVADARAKLRAVDLTRETVGVTRVVDELTVRPVSPGGTTTTTTTTTIKTDRTPAPAP